MDNAAEALAALYALDSGRVVLGLVTPRRHHTQPPSDAHLKVQGISFTAERKGLVFGLDERDGGSGQDHIQFYL